MLAAYNAVTIVAAITYADGTVLNFTSSCASWRTGYLSRLSKMADEQVGKPR